MQILQRFSSVFRNRLPIGSRHTHVAIHVSTQESMADLERQLHTIGRQEQIIARQILTMAGSAVLVQSNTFATDDHNHPCLLEKGRKVKLSEYPLTLDRHGNARINMLDESDNPLSMRLSDYILDIYASRQGQDETGAPESPI